jgi:hypothetical protein
MKALHSKAISVLEDALNSEDESTRVKVALTVIKSIRLPEPIDLDSMPEDKLKDYERKKRNYGLYYAYHDNPIPDFYPISNYCITWDKSEHQSQHQSDYDHFIPSEQECLLLTEEELTSLANRLEVGGVYCEKVQDVVIVFTSCGVPFCKIFTERAEQESALNYQVLNRSDRRAVYRTLRPSKEHLYSVNHGINPILRIPRNTDIDQLVELLKGIAQSGHHS